MVLFVLIQTAIALSKRPSVVYIVLNAILLVITLCSFIFTALLLGFHFYLIATNTTTYEFYKQNWKSISGNPYRKNFCVKNMIKAMGNHDEPPLVNPYELVEKRNQNKEKELDFEDLSSKTLGVIPSQDMFKLPFDKPN